MRRQVVVPLLLVLALGACSDDEPAPDVEPSPAPPASTAPPAAPSSSPSASPSGDVVPVLAAFAQEQPTELVVQVDRCPPVLRYEVVETAERVEVSLTGEGSVPCADGPRNVLLALEAPLADREVVDGATGQPVAVAVGDPPGPPVPTVAATPR